MHTMDQKISSKSLTRSFELMNLKRLDEAKQLLDEGMKEAKAANDKILTALFYSGYGVYHKLRKEYRKAWRAYEQAERLIPDDPSLKIISARLLVDFFGQYGTVVKKMERVIAMVGSNFPYLHQAYTLQGVAFFKNGNKKEAIACLKKSMAGNLSRLETLSNLDMNLIHEFLKKKTEMALCRQYLEAARDFARKTKEAHYEKFILRLLDLIPKDPK